MEDLEKAIVEINRYMECQSFSIDIESCEIATKAIEKQMPKKPREGSRAIKVGIEGANCGVCGGLIFMPNIYCGKCGQKINWEA